MLGLYHRELRRQQTAAGKLPHTFGSQIAYIEERMRNLDERRCQLNRDNLARHPLPISLAEQLVDDGAKHSAEFDNVLLHLMGGVARHT